jgi:uncharacterized membrane protein YfcA
MAPGQRMNSPAHPPLRPGVSLTVFLFACYAGSPPASTSVIAKNGQYRRGRSVYHGFVSRWHRLRLYVLSFVGVWLGFIVLDGATYLLLVLILLFGYDLPHASALKVFLLVTTTLVPIALFARAGNIWWTEGLLLSVGSLVGGHFGAKLSSHEKARTWVFRTLVAVIVLELIHLAMQYL